MKSVRRARCWAAGTAVAAAFAAGGPAIAATAAGSFSVQLVIQSQCTVASTSTLDFGTTGVLNSNVDASTTFGVQCTNGTPYTVSLDAGAGAGADTTTRRLTSGGAVVDYRLFSDSGRTANWGVGADAVSSTGDGSSQTHTVYGRVIVQPTPAAGAYTDTIQVTVTY